MRNVPAIKELREICKSKCSGYWVPVIDYVSFWPAKFFLYLPFTPNQITMIWIIIKIIAAFFLVTGDYWFMLIAVTIFQSALILGYPAETLVLYTVFLFL